MDELLEEDISLSLSPSIRGNRFVVSIGFKNRLVEAIVVRNRIIPRDGITSKISPLFLFFSRPNTLLRRPFISIFRESVHINRKRKNKLVSKKPRIHPGNTACTTDKRGIQRGERGNGTRHCVGKDPCVDMSDDIPTDRGSNPEGRAPTSIRFDHLR